METERIKRIDREPEDNQLADSILGDFSVGRNAELKSFLDLLCRIDGNYSIFLDGDWGVGKTFFVKQAIMCLRTFPTQAYCEEYGIDKDRKAELEAAVKPVSWGKDTVQVPAYFNAWEYDYSSNPVVPLLDSLILTFPDQFEAQADARSFRDWLAGISVELSIGIGPASLSVEKTTDAQQSNLLTSSIDLQKRIRSGVNNVLRGCLERRGNRVVLFIDELDRCRPEFAISVLESVKFLFSQDILTVVFSVNSKALAKVVSSRYGDGFDGSRYLMRFYDRVFALDSFNCKNYLISYLFDGNAELTKMIDASVSTVRSHNLSMRDINRCIPNMRKSVEFIETTSPPRYFSHVYLPLLFGLASLLPLSGLSVEMLLPQTEGENIFSSWFIADGGFCQALADTNNDLFRLDDSRINLNLMPLNSSVISSRVKEFFYFIFSPDDNHRKLPISGATKALQEMRGQVICLFSEQDSYTLK